MASNKKKIHLKVNVVIDADDEPGTETRCPIAESTSASSPDITHVKVNRDRIMFSRSSTGLRYVYKTPPVAAAFVDKLDELAQKESFTEEDWPDPFTLLLREEDVLQITPRTTGRRVSKSRQPVNQTVGALQTQNLKTSTKVSKTAKAPSSTTKAGERIKRPVFRKVAA